MDLALNESAAAVFDNAAQSALTISGLPFAFSASVAFASWVIYKGIQAPPMKVCGTPNGLPVTAPRIKLRDGRYLAYREAGVPKEEANFKIVTIHGYGGSRNTLLGCISEDLVKELGIYFVGFDRAGYGQSTPNPKRNLKSDALDVQDLADGLDLGSTFYVASMSLGCYTSYALMKYLPHRLAGVVLFAPVVNFWWSGMPRALASRSFAKQEIGDRLALSVVHHAPWLVYWYFNQTLLPTSTTVKLEKNQYEANEKLRMTKDYVAPLEFNYPIQQGKDESQYRDARIMFGKWDFEPFDLENPFAGRSGSVHIWQGTNDYLVPTEMQREIARRLPWINYHEVAGVGHSLLSHPGLPDQMIRSFLAGKN